MRQPAATLGRAVMGRQTVEADPKRAGARTAIIRTAWVGVKE